MADLSILDTDDIANALGTQLLEKLAQQKAIEALTAELAARPQRRVRPVPAGPPPIDIEAHRPPPEDDGLPAA